MFDSLFDRWMVEARLLWRLWTDSRVSFWPKLIPVAAVLYILSPVDLIPDVLIGLGQLDDIGILLASLRVFKSMVPDYLIREHMELLSGQVVAARDYKVTDKD
jgi:uncharacterized membrane protein YkvA (DUF1232 family)